MISEARFITRRAFALAGLTAFLPRLQAQQSQIADCSRRCSVGPWLAVVMERRCSFARGAGTGYILGNDLLLSFKMVGTKVRLTSATFNFDPKTLQGRKINTRQNFGQYVIELPSMPVTETLIRVPGETGQPLLEGMLVKYRDELDVAQIENALFETDPPPESTVVHLMTDDRRAFQLNYDLKGCSDAYQRLTAMGAQLWAAPVPDCSRQESVDSDSGSKGAACYLTSACVQLLGLGDDCWELRSLRRLRDEHILLTPKGRAEVALYYATAPQIMHQIMANEHSRLQLSSLYRCYIFPAACLASVRANAAAHCLYRKMMRRLLE